jgi:hypothetical protein
MLISCFGYVAFIDAYFVRGTGNQPTDSEHCFILVMSKSQSK